MIARLRVEVANRKDAELLRRGLAQADVRAFVQVVGALAPLRSDAARASVLRFVGESLAAED